MKVTRIGAAAPEGSPRHVADCPREWADRVESGDVMAYGLVMVHGPDKTLHMAWRGMNPDSSDDCVKLFAGLQLAADMVAEHVRDAMFAEVDVHDLER